MKKAILSIVLMALLAACADSGSSPVAPDNTSSSSISWNKYSSSGDVQTDNDSLVERVRVEVYAVCDSFNLDAAVSVLSSNGWVDEFNVGKEFAQVCNAEDLVGKGCMTRTCITEKLAEVGIVIDDDLLDDAILNHSSLTPYTRILYVNGVPYMVRFK